LSGLLEAKKKGNLEGNLSTRRRPGVRMCTGFVVKAGKVCIRQWSMLMMGLLSLAFCFVVRLGKTSLWREKGYVCLCSKRDAMA